MSTTSSIPELDVLVVAPHPDDAEISVGGTILVCKQAGLKVGVIELTNGEPTPHGSLEIRAQETKAATEVLQLDWRGNLDLPNRSLQNTLEARAQLAGIFRQARPKVILAPYWEDVHPDHVVASQLADDARFWSKLSNIDLPGERYWPPTMYYFWSIHLRNHPDPSFVIDISKTLEQKMQAVRCYESQMITGRPQEHPTVLDDIQDCNRYWGWSIHTAYGEAFASREEIGLPMFPTLLGKPPLP